MAEIEISDVRISVNSQLDENDIFALAKIMRGHMIKLIVNGRIICTVLIED